MAFGVVQSLRLTAVPATPVEVVTAVIVPALLSTTYAVAPSGENAIACGAAVPSDVVPPVIPEPSWIDMTLAPPAFATYATNGLPFPSAITGVVPVSTGVVTLLVAI
jgi:hypothetical protein